MTDSFPQLDTIILDNLSLHKAEYYGIIPFGDSMERSNIEKIAQSNDDKVLLAKLWDKINAGMRKNILSSTCFLSAREQEMAKYPFGSP